jgi:DNA-directed RNA polymerase subunit RPC12/RpoP
MVVAKCVKCDKEYELESDEEPSNFQCECGGELKSKEIVSKPVKTIPTKNKPDIKEEWNKQSKNRKIGIGILGVCCIGIILFIGVGGLLSPNQTSSSGGTSFQNQYVSFQYPTGFDVKEITDSSASSKTLDVGIYQNGNLVGEISYYQNQPADLTTMQKTYTQTTTAGKNALENSASDGLYDEILLGTSSSGENKIIRIETDKDQTTLYQKIKETFTIKQTPPDD